MQSKYAAYSPSIGTIKQVIAAAIKAMHITAFFFMKPPNAFTAAALVLRSFISGSSVAACGCCLFTADRTNIPPPARNFKCCGHIEREYCRLVLTYCKALDIIHIYIYRRNKNGFSEFNYPPPLRICGGGAFEQARLFRKNTLGIKLWITSG